MCASCNARVLVMFIIVDDIYIFFKIAFRITSIYPKLGRVRCFRKLTRPIILARVINKQT